MFPIRPLLEKITAMIGSFSVSVLTPLPAPLSITATLPSSPAAQPSCLPPGWQEFSRAGQLVRFIDRAYSPATTEAACRTRFPSAAIAAHPMTLREIFITLARAGRAEAKLAAA